MYDILKLYSINSKRQLYQLGEKSNEFISMKIFESGQQIIQQSESSYDFICREALLIFDKIKRIRTLGLFIYILPKI